MEKVQSGDPIAEVTLLRKAEMCRLLGISSWTVDQWRRRERFPQPIFITDGSPARWRLSQVRRWIDNRERRRRRVIRRGKLKRGSN